MSERLDLSPDLAEIERLNIWFGELCAQAMLNPGVAGDMKLCLNEAVTNVMSYGQITSGLISCEVDMDAVRVQVVLSDTGVPFNPLEAPIADPMNGLETAQIGGFGIKLIRETAREIAYRRDGNHNILTMVCT